ncbi:MAG TPA: hypothetical protein PK299_08120 [Anaerolineales bacterium]|nr:hypothetical protein [Anaerolineales bacterium]
MSRNALWLYKTAELARIDVKISLTHSRYVLFRHPILHVVALDMTHGYKVALFGTGRIEISKTD